MRKCLRRLPDTLNVGAIRGRIIPANPFVLAIFPAPSPDLSATGIVGAQVVAVDANTGTGIAGALGSSAIEARRQICRIAARPVFGQRSAIVQTPALNTNFNVRAFPHCNDWSKFCDTKL